MPTHEEIKKIAREYAEYHGSIGTGITEDVLNWLSKDFVIVPKEVIKADYDFNKTAVEQFAKSDATRCVIVREWHQGKCDELISLFGKPLFNEEKE